MVNVCDTIEYYWFVINADICSSISRLLRGIALSNYCIHNNYLTRIQFKLPMIKYITIVTLSN